MRISNKTLILLLMVCLALISVTGCETLQKLLQNPDYIYENGAILVDGADQPIHLINNPAAVDVSFQDVLALIRLDTTDLLEYVERGNPEGIRPFVCSDFAEAVHNHAEAAGIRAGYVSIDWAEGSIGHAIDAFETTDRGLVFFDCTGKSVFSEVERSDSKIAVGSWDKVAYLEVGKKYGAIGLAYAGATDYAFFEQYDQQWARFRQLLAEYNEEVKLYNQAIQGKVLHRGSLEFERIKVWEDELIALENQLDEMTLEIGDSRFRPLGIVSNYEIHW
jgi:hypothetical protein